MSGTTEQLLSTSDLKDRNLRPRTGEIPARVELWQNHGRKGSRHLWRLDQSVEIKKQVPPAIRLEGTPENIMLAVWSVNRAAKRRRDAAEFFYLIGKHGFARTQKVMKSHYYYLKDRGIAWLAHHGHLAPLYRHGGLVVWGCANYSFHCSLAPHGVELAAVGSDLVRIESSPAGSKEMRLRDAMALLESLESFTADYFLIKTDWPQPRPETDDIWDEEEDDD